MTGMAEATLKDELKKTQARITNLRRSLKALEHKTSAYAEEHRVLIEVFSDHATRIKDALALELPEKGETE